MYFPFLSVTTASTSTMRDSVLMTGSGAVAAAWSVGGAGGCGASCAKAGAMTPPKANARKTRAESSVRLESDGIRVRIGTSSIWYFNRTISRGHLGSFGIPDDLANHVSSGFDVEAGLNDQAGTSQFFVRRIEQFYREQIRRR